MFSKVLNRLTTSCTCASERTAGEGEEPGARWWNFSDLVTVMQQEGPLSRLHSRPHSSTLCFFPPWLFYQRSGGSVVLIPGPKSLCLNGQNRRANKHMQRRTNAQRRHQWWQRQANKWFLFAGAAVGNGLVWANQSKTVCWYIHSCDN